ncbi:MAG: beta-galatosidase, partial [Acidobacteria bacterium]|nr:beta-galatosidase [Acidobacteriota bacterium]
TWLQAGLDHRPADELVQHRCTTRDIDGGREYRHSVVVPEELADLPRIGVTFELPARFSQVRWHGRGPHENYPDRNSSAMPGIWQQAPDAMPYLVPQEFGLRTDCRWIELIDPESGEVLRVDVLQPRSMHFSATRHTAAQLYEASTATELRMSPNLVVHLDVAHRGLGTASCGPDVLPKYRIPAGTYRFAYRLTPSPRT